MTVFTELPPELLALIAEQLADERRTLRTLAMTCHQLQDVAETILYRDIFLRRGSECISLIHNLNVRPQRAKATHRIELRGLNRHEVGLQKFHKLLRLVPNLQELVYESPVANHRLWNNDGNWRALIEPIKSLFYDLSHYSRLTRGQDILPLNALRRLTLHWNGVGWRYWAANEVFEGLFAHPHLEELSVSCATILNPLTVDLPQTPLRKLNLIECDISVSGLKAVLALPRALEHLYLGENRDHPKTIGKTERILGGATDPEKFLEALSQQRHSLKSFVYRPRSEFYDDDSFRCSENFGFSGFEQLEAVSILCQSRSLEDLLTSTSTAPPRLASLNFSHDMPPRRRRGLGTTVANNNGNIHVVASDDQETPQSIMARSRMARICEHVSVLDSVKEISFVSKRFADTEQNREMLIMAFEAPEKVLVSRKKRLVLLKEEGQRFIPPYLYGEQEPCTTVMYDTESSPWPKTVTNRSTDGVLGETTMGGASPLSDSDLEMDGHDLVYH